MYDFHIPHSNDFNAISKTRHVIVLALCLAWGLLGTQPPVPRPFSACLAFPLSPPLQSPSTSKAGSLPQPLGLRSTQPGNPALTEDQVPSVWAVGTVCSAQPGWSPWVRARGLPLPHLCSLGWACGAGQGDGHLSPDNGKEVVSGWLLRANL